jgi:hypothetical protein
MSGRPHVHHYRLPPQGSGPTVVGRCACGATTAPLPNVWRGDEEMGDEQRAKIGAAAARHHAARRAERRAAVTKRKAGHE